MHAGTRVGATLGHVRRSRYSARPMNRGSTNGRYVRAVARGALEPLNHALREPQVGADAQTLVTP